MNGQVSANLIAGFSVVVSLLIGFISVRAVYDVRDRGDVAVKSLQSSYIGPVNPLADLRQVEDKISIEVNTQGNKINNLQVMRARLENNGRSPILPSDIFEPLSLSTQAPWEIITVVDASDGTAKTVPLKWERTSATQFTAKPALLNPGDKVAATVYLTQKGLKEGSEQSEKAKVTWSGRVSNLQSITEAPDFWDDFNKKMGLPIFVMVWGWGVPLIVILFSTFFTLYLLLFLRLEWLADWSRWAATRVVGAAIVSICAAEAGTTYIVGTFPLFASGPSHLMNAPITILNAVFLVWLMILAWRKARAESAQLKLF